MSTNDEIKKIEKKKRELFSELKPIRNMIRGTYVQTHRKCGKANCRCSREEIGHPCYQLSWSKDGRSRSKAIPKDDISWIKEMTGYYKKWRSIRTDIRKLEDQERKLITREEEDIIQRTEKLRKYFSEKRT